MTKKHSIDLCNKYEKDLNRIEFIHEIESFKQHICELDDSLRYGICFEIQNCIYKNNV